MPPETICPTWSALIDPRNPVFAEPSTTYTAPAPLVPGLTNGALNPISSSRFPDRSPRRPTAQPSPPPAETPRQITPSTVLPTWLAPITELASRPVVWITRPAFGTGVVSRHGSPGLATAS